MEYYLVGGAVRDQLLNIAVKDRDYVVVGSTPQDMTNRGFIPVGDDFPVFLHPISKQEYALARTERKSGRGYHGFTVDASPQVTLEEDLQRRDLTINAMAINEDSGILIDPWGGKTDLQNRILRHVSPAFAEDPLRVLRVARFMARFAHLGFTVHPQTVILMQQLVADNELQDLPPERIWQEIKNSLNETTPSAFFWTLRESGALKQLLPEIDAYFGVPQTRQWHPEIDTGVHALLAIDNAKNLSNEVAYAVMVHDLGKGITPKHELPSHRGHEATGVPLVRAVSQRLKVPKSYQQLAELVCRLHLKAHTIEQLRAKTVNRLFQDLDAYRRPQRFEQFVQACQADATGRWGDDFQDYPQADKLRQLFQAANAVDIKPLIEAGYEGEKLGHQIRQKRIRAIELKQTELIKKPC
ncbi:MAG: multifunctional CCA addition/repair protein [Proteobacteria bacterium]|nr:MAG: multifunctional CCA addition/repair protein [Pseudomonadota bacterium]